MAATTKKLIQELQSAIQELGASRVEATLVVKMLKDGPQTTSQLVDDAGLRQPEVSMGMKNLRSRDWVQTEKIPREGKGRPMHRYSLTVSAAQVRRYYEEAGKGQITQYKDAIQLLKQHIK